MSIIEQLSAGNFITVNRTAAAIVGLDAAVILGELASEALYWSEHDPNYSGWFYSTVENLEKRTFLSAHSQRQAIERLQKEGWIDTEKRGMPARRYIRINEENISECLHNKSLKNLTTRRQKNEQQDVKKLNDYYNNKDNKKKEKEKREEKRPAVVENHPIEQKDVETIIDMLLNAYPYAIKKIEKDKVIQVWMAAFDGERSSILYKAVRQHIRTNKFFPAITEINEQISRIYLTDIPKPEMPSRSGQQEPAEELPDEFFDNLIE